MQKVHMTLEPKSLNIAQILEHVRLVIMLLALTTGVLLVSNLWEQTLARETMASAGKGVIFILLALGLMGTHRLSVALTAMLCSTGVLGLLSRGHPMALTDWLQVLMLFICAGLLFASDGGRSRNQYE